MIKAKKCENKFLNVINITEAKRNEIIFTIIYLIVSFLISSLLYMKGYNNHHILLQNLTFSNHGADYISEKLSIPQGVVKLTVMYLSDKDTSMEVLLNNERLSTVSISATDGEITSQEILCEVKRGTSNFAISFKNVDENNIKIQSVDVLANRSLYNDYILKSVICFLFFIVILYITGLLYYKKISLKCTIRIFTITGFVFFVSMPLMTDYYICGHDLWGFCGRIEGIKEAILEGQIFPVVLPNANNGYGYLGFMYPELFLLIPAWFRIMNISMATSIQVFIILINSVTAIIAYISVKSILDTIATEKEKTSAGIVSTFSTLYYLMAPYRLTDIYTRAAIGEAMAMAFLPIVIAGLYHVMLGNRKKWYYLVIGLTGILHSHILSCVMVIPMIIIIIIACIRSLTNEKRIKELFMSIIVFLGINSWYIIPFIRFYLFGLNSEALIVKDVENHTVPFSQLFAIGTGNLQNDEMVRTIGMSSLIILVLVAMYYFEKISWLVNPVEYYIGHCETEKKKLESNAEIGKEEGLKYKNSVEGCEIERTKYKKFNGEKYINILSIIFLLYFILSTDIMPWKYFNENSEIISRISCMLQFPFRLLTVVSALLMFMMGIALLKTKFGRRYFKNIILTICVFSMFNCRSFFDLHGNGYRSLGFVTGGFDDHIPYDYLPQDTNPEIFNDNRIIIDENILKNYSKDGTKISIEYESDKDTSADVPLLFYPCYKAVDENGNRIETFKTEKNKLGILLPSGKHKINIRVSMLP